MTPGLIEIVIAVIASGAISAFITAWFARRKQSGEASEAFASAAGLVATQNEKLIVQMNEIRLKLTDLECNHRILQTNHDVLILELHKRDVEILLLKDEIKRLRIALRLEMKGEGQ